MQLKVVTQYLWHLSSDQAGGFEIQTSWIGLAVACRTLDLRVVGSSPVTDDCLCGAYSTHLVRPYAWNTRYYVDAETSRFSGICGWIL